MTLQIIPGLLAILCSTALVGCGLEIVRGELVRIEKDHYVLREAGGREMRLHVDQRTHKDRLSPGDEVRVFVEENGHADFIQRLGPLKP